MNEKVPPTASNRRKRELVREGNLLTYKRKRKTIDPSTVVPPNIIDTANEGISEPVPPIEPAQAAFRAQPPLPNISPDSDVNIPIEKLPVRVHHHQSTWDLTKEPQVVQDFVKFKGFDRIGAISHNFYNSTLISTFAKCWQPETNSFYFKWGEMTPTLDNVEQLDGLHTDGDFTVIGGTWGFPALLKVFQNNLLQDLNALESLKAGGAGNSLSLKKLKDHYAYKLEKVLSNGTAAAAKKKKGLIARFAARAYILYVLGSFLFPTKRVHMSAHGTMTYLPRTRWQGSGHGDQQFWPTCITIWVQHLKMMGNNLHDIFAHFPKLAGIPKEMDSDAYDDVGIHQRKEASVSEHGDTPVHQSEDVAEQYNTSYHEHASLSLNAYDTMPTRGRSDGFDQQITTLNDQLQKLKEDKKRILKPI
ncbi:hypothetical protein GIB67_027316 [Kingdonia uniflora]|uniref:Aminotransferase-like plant mobile domain-containing protein n=1 Tax=Kingdonia uniflora TaxID=39325 RepID=A0A7J7KYR0_9MAGN|nr:hypothetical protein GIB67_027316 [Kingdonia uniflora]